MAANKAIKTTIQRAPLFPVNLRIQKSLDRAVEIEAAVRDITKQQLIENALLAYLGVEFEPERDSQ